MEDRPAINTLNLRRVLKRAKRLGVKVNPQDMLDILDGKAKG